MGVPPVTPDRGPGQATTPGRCSRRQLLLFSVIAAVVLVVVAAWLGMGGGKSPAPVGGIDAGIVAPDVAEKVWTRRSEARLGEIETNLRQIQQEARTACAPTTTGCARSWERMRPTRAA